jgi:hypothetical protein
VGKLGLDGVFGNDASAVDMGIPERAMPLT